MDSPSPMANCIGPDPFRQRVVGSGGAVHQLGVLRPLVPAPVAGSAEAPAHPSPRKDAASSDDSRRSKKTAFDARKLPRRRSHGLDTRAEWILSGAPRRPAATAIEEQRALPQSSCPLPALGRCRRKSYRDRGASTSEFDQTEMLRAVAVPPIPRGMRGDIKVDHPAPVMRQHQKHVQHLESDRRNGKEVDGHQVLDVIVQEGTPGLRGWLAVPHHVLGHAGLTALDAQFEQFPVDMGCAPKRVLTAHPQTEVRAVSPAFCRRVR
jgi:hypothetical protein